MSGDRTLVLGASLKGMRYSNFAMKQLSRAGHNVVGVGLLEGEVNGVPVITGKPELDEIDTVTVYMRAERQHEYYQYVEGLQPRRVIFNPGAENPKWKAHLENDGVEVLDACTLVMLSVGNY